MKTELTETQIVNKIHIIRKEKVMLDQDLAELYDVETSYLKRQVRRNIDRFPEDFMFELTNEEFENLRSQNGTSSWGGSRYTPMAFTEQGVAQLSSVLNSGRAIQVNIQIRIDYLGKDINGKFHLGDAKFTTKDKNWNSDWLDPSSVNQNSVFPLFQSGGVNSIVVKATDSDKLIQLAS
ncbi:MAG: ORF6N domain-containing protein [Saprospiraceae bacterium]